MRISLGQKIGLVFVVLILIYGMLLGSSFYTFAKNYAGDEIMRSNQQTVRNVQDYYLQSFLTDMTKIVTYWSVYPGLLIHEDSVDTRSQGYAQMQREWQSYLTLNRSVSCIYFGAATDGSLHEVPVKMGLPTNYDSRKRTWYTGAMADPDGVYWSRPYQDIGAGGDMVLTVSKVVRDGDTIVGVIGMDIKLRSFSRMLTGVYANQSGYLVVLDEKGDVYAHPDEQRLATNLGYESWAKDALKGTEGKGAFKRGGKEYVYSYVTLGETGWKLVGIREIDFAELVDNLKAMIVFTGIMVALVLMLAAGVTARYILKPLGIIMETIRAVARGEMHARSALLEGMDTHDEITEISVAFNSMLDRIHEMNIERDKHLEALLEQNQEIQDQKQEIYSLYEISDTMNQELEELLQRTKAGYLATVRSLANAIEANDQYTRGHCQRVSEFAAMLGERVGFTAGEMKDLEFACILHDIGKIGIPKEILHKPGRLTSEEYAQMRLHPLIGAEILRDVTFLENTREILLQHHERIDGKGYPEGLSGDRIVLAAKILAIADSFDAMTSVRPYRSGAMSVEEALAELDKGKGTQFDASLVEQFLVLFRNTAQMPLAPHKPAAVEISAG